MDDHAKRRFKKRLGRELSDLELEVFNELISQNHEQAELVMWEKGDEVAVYKISWMREEFYAFYRLEENRIISFKALDDTIYPKEE